MSYAYRELPAEQKNILKLAILACAYQRPGRKPRSSLYRPLQRITAHRIRGLNDDMISSACADLGLDFKEMVLLPVALPLTDALSLGGWDASEWNWNQGKPRSEVYARALKKMKCKHRQQHAQAIVGLAEICPPPSHHYRNHPPERHPRRCAYQAVSKPITAEGFWTMSNLAPDLLCARRFLDCLVGEESLHLFGCIPLDKSSRVEHLSGTLDECAQQLSNKNAANNGVYFTVNEISGTVRRAEKVTRVRALFLDLDGAPLEPVLDCALPPHMIVETSPERWHAYWQVADCPTSQFKTLQRSLAARFDGDPSVCDLPRLMRLPGFYHKKLRQGSNAPTDPFMSRVIGGHVQPAYSVEALIAGLELKIGITNDPAPANTSKNSFDPQRIYHDGERTHALTQYCGKLVSANVEDNRALSQLNDWNTFKCNPPLAQDKLRATYESIKQTHARNNTTVNDEIDKINKRHAVVLYSGKTLVLRERTDGIDFMSIADFNNFNANWPRIQNQEATRHWLKHPSRRQYEKVVFNPQASPADKTAYNLWRGFAVKPSKGDCSLYLDHLLNVTCSNNPSYFNYLIGWMAHAVQRPQELPGVAVVLKGGRGTGKGMTVQPFGRLFGSHFSHQTSRESFLGRFNSQLQDKVVIFADEVFWSGDRAHEGSLKTMITEPRRQFEAKGRPIVELDNFTRLIMATNDEWAVPAGADERRFFVLDVSNCRQGDHSYFDALSNQMNHEGLSALLEHLLNVDLSCFNPRAVPATSALADQKIHSLDTIGTWWHDCLSSAAIGTCDAEGHLCNLDTLRVKGSAQWPSFASTGELYAHYQQHAKSTGHRYTGSSSAFIKKLKKIAELKPERPEVRGQRVCGYRLPKVDAARTSFCKMIGQTVAWETSDPSVEI